MQAFRQPQWQSVGLAWVAGYVDTLGFMALLGLFTAHVTGNFVLVAIGLADAARTGIWVKLLAFPAFVAGIVAARLWIAYALGRAWPALRLALALQALLLTGFMLCGWWAGPVDAALTPPAALAGLLGAAAMGVHSATSRLLLAHLAPTSMMTGNVTQLVIDSVDVLRGDADGGAGARCAKFFWPLLAFAGGAVAAAFAYRGWGFAALLPPIAILGGLMAWDGVAPERV